MTLHRGKTIGNLIALVERITGAPVVVVACPMCQRDGVCDVCAGRGSVELLADEAEEIISGWMDNKYDA